jgi:hypothetical protein
LSDIANIFGVHVYSGELVLSEEYTQREIRKTRELAQAEFVLA